MSLRLEVARTEDELRRLGGVWNELQSPYVSSDLEFLLTQVKSKPTALRPHAVALFDADRPVGLVSGRLEDLPVHAKLGPARLRTLIVTYGGFMGPADEATATRLLEAVTASVAPGEVDVIRLRMLRIGSPLHRVAIERSRWLRREYFAAPVLHWQAEIPRSLDDFLARRSRRRRESVRRYARRLERSYGDEARVEVFRVRREIDRLFADSAAVHRATYQHGLGVGFSSGETERALTELAMDRGWFRGYVLYLRDTPVAFWHGNAYKGVFGVGATAFDPAFGEDRPGTYLLMRLVEDLAADPSVHTLDFGFGDADYKRHFGDESWLEEDVVLVEPRARPLALNLARTTMLGATRAARGAAERAGALSALRRRRRERSMKDA